MSLFSFPKLLPDGPVPSLPDYAIGFLYSGAVTGEISINKGKWMPRTSVGKGSIDLWPRSYELNWRWWPNENPEPIKIASTILSGDLLKKTSIEALDLEPNLIEFPNKLNVNDPFIEQLFFSVIDELERGNPCGKLYGDTAAQMLALHLLSKHCTFNHKIPAYNRGIPPTLLRRVLDYIHARFNEDISLESMALIAGLSCYHFLRMFKQSAGKTPLQYIIELRMESAKRFLLQTDLSITEIGFEVGYDSASHFINLFKRYTGITPSQYRKGC